MFTTKKVSPRHTSKKTQSPNNIALYSYKFRYGLFSDVIFTDVIMYCICMLIMTIAHSLCSLHPPSSLFWRGWTERPFRVHVNIIIWVGASVLMLHNRWHLCKQGQVPLYNNEDKLSTKYLPMVPLISYLQAWIWAYKNAQAHKWFSNVAIKTFHLFTLAIFPLSSHNWLPVTALSWSWLQWNLEPIL